MLNKKNKSNIAVIFGKEVSISHLRSFDCQIVLAEDSLKDKIESAGFFWESLENLIGWEDIYEANKLLKDVSSTKLPNGQLVSKSFLYKGYELWWANYNNLYLYFCLPFTKYKNLLNYLKNFDLVYLYKPEYQSLFSTYLKAWGCRATTIQQKKFLNFGIFLQVLLTMVSFPFLVFFRKKVMVFTGDKFAEGKDYDFRLEFIYKELRGRNIPFFEVIRSLEKSKTILQNFFLRKRPAVYSQAVVYMAKVICFFMKTISFDRKKITEQNFSFIENKEERFKSLIAVQYLSDVWVDVWAIRLMRIILKFTGAKAAYITATSERNFHTVFGCKLNNISTVGILHGVGSRWGTPYDFLPGFEGKKFSVDKYGLWSNWWKDYYTKHSRAYEEDQLFVSGPMRPPKTLANKEGELKEGGGLTRVLFVSEQTANYQEIMPYLEELVLKKDISLSIKFRPFRDKFENWLKENRPEILESKNIKIFKCPMAEAIGQHDIAVGCHSTGVLEALLQLKTPIFIYTKKWGDYYEFGESTKKKVLLVESPQELMERINSYKSVPKELIEEMRGQYFGDHNKNGSKWVVDQIESYLISRQNHLW